MNNFKMTNCRICGEPVAKNASKCPHCGAHTPNRSTLVAAIIALCFIGFILILLVISSGEDTSGASSNQTTQTVRNTVSSTEPEPVQYIEVTAEALWTAYQENEVNADLLYGSKLLSITGTITNIGKDIASAAPCVSLDSGNAYGINPIQCFFPKNGSETEQLAALSDGDVITIYGKCTGVFLVNVQLSKCSLNP